MFMTTCPRIFSIVSSAYIPERHVEIPYHGAENRRRRKEYLSVLAGLPCIDRGDFLPGGFDQAEKRH